MVKGKAGATAEAVITRAATGVTKAEGRQEQRTAGDREEVAGEGTMGEKQRMTEA